MTGTFLNGVAEYRSLALIFILALLINFIGCSSKPIPKKTIATPTIYKYSESPPDSLVRILFIHHSTGGNWLADRGPEELLPGVERGSNIYLKHENGGGLRNTLASVVTDSGQLAYEIHEVGRKSIIGSETNVCHWYSKFTSLFDQEDSTKVDMLNVEIQDSINPESQNEIVMFKSCYPASDLEPDGPTANPLADPEKTIGNYKAVYNALLNDVFRVERKAENRALFVVVTAPPRANDDCNVKQAAVAREFNNWLRTEWLADVDTNVVVFDYFNINTGGIGNDLDGSWQQGTVNYSAYLTGGDSHPNYMAQAVATKEYLRFINLAYNRWKGIYHKSLK